MVTNGILNNYLTTELFVEQVCPTDLELDPRNARTHSKKQIGQIAEWDEELLARELEFLSEIEVDFDVEITGFEPAEIDLLIEGLEPAKAIPRPMQSRSPRGSRMSPSRLAISGFSGSTGCCAAMRGIPGPSGAS